ncbi:MAG: hypothetical protein A2Y82_03460 [Candidatus Buchananbacteria bacterium RBG_13_36_9]|uniref:DUF5698 domain-containing protein n=1 Tax=Candidatus Buchananbacteria bacterium RBG_13_36_9 TaxID=1797530 RepID=A0A1G1XLQ3_9BACT|nr:MAG: hypothetical protein A2Y82_03460 [Candidatus Buchananbacteria bacterium RBG_13_36_9]
MILFLVGIFEMLIVTVWTKVVTKTQILASGFITLINVLIWYYVLQTIVDNISNWIIALLYALGCAVGTMIATLYFQHEENKNYAGK